MRPLMLPKMIFATAFAAGCAGTVGYSASVSGGYDAPDLVEASPGVMVIADYDEPIFYTDNVYWRFDGGTWYRSTSYTGGWVYAQPPEVIVRIDRPQRYAHYRPQGWTPNRGQVRDHREPTPRAMRQPPPRVAPPPARDQRPEMPPSELAPAPRQQAPTRTPDRRGDQGGSHDHRGRGK